MAKTVVVTGSSRGIGNEIALAFAHAGYNVVVNSKSSVKEGNEVANECAKSGVRAMYVQANVATAAGAKKLISSAIEAFGKIDVLVNNAGKTQKKLFIDSTEKDVEDILFGNIASCIYPSIECINEMKNYGGSIVNISSMQANTKASTEALYASSKAAVLGLTKALAAEYGPCNIRVNAICPGFIETDMTKNYTKKEKQEFCELVPLGRLGKTTDVAELVLFLASDKAGYITGAIFDVDGGVTKA